jgi:hypothetical protein
VKEGDEEEKLKTYKEKKEELQRGKRNGKQRLL